MSADGPYANILAVLEFELSIITAAMPQLDRYTVAQAKVEQIRLAMAQFARVIDDVLNGSKASACTPERAADAAFKLVTLLRELPRSAS